MQKSANSDEVRVYLAEQIKKARHLQGITQLAMAKRLGIARQTYLDIESGKTEPRSVMIYNIAKVTKRPVVFFYPDDEELYQNIIDNALQTVAAIERQTYLLKRDLKGESFDRSMSN